MPVGFDGPGGSVWPGNRVMNAPKVEGNLHTLRLKVLWYNHRTFGRSCAALATTLNFGGAGGLRTCQTGVE